MEKRFLIVQSNPAIFGDFQITMAQEYPKIARVTLYAETFEEVKVKTPKDGKLVVIASNFYKTPDHDMDGVMLAEVIHGINSEAEVHIFSRSQPKESKFVKSFILKNQLGDISLTDVSIALDTVLKNF